MENSNVFVDLSWDIKVPYLAIWALFCKCDLLLGQHNKEYFPIENDFNHFVETNTASGHYYDFQSGIPLEGNQINRNIDRCVYKPNIDSIRLNLRKCYESWKLRKK